MQLTSVKTLNGINYEDWKESLDLYLTSSCVKFFNETKQVLNNHFDMKDLGDAFFVLGIQIHRDRSKGILGLSQRGYIEKKSSNGLTCILVRHVLHPFKRVISSLNLNVLKMKMRELKWKRSHMLHLLAA